MRNNYGSRIRSERSRLKTWNHVLCLSEIACSVFLLDFIHLVLQIVRVFTLLKRKIQFRIVSFLLIVTVVLISTNQRQNILFVNCIVF